MENSENKNLSWADTRKRAKELGITGITKYKKEELLRLMDEKEKEAGEQAQSPANSAENQPEHTAESLATAKLPLLREIAQGLGVKNIARYKKAELARLIVELQQKPEKKETKEEIKEKVKEEVKKEVAKEVAKAEVKEEVKEDIQIEEIIEEVKIDEVKQEEPKAAEMPVAVTPVRPPDRQTDRQERASHKADYLVT